MDHFAIGEGARAIINVGALVVTLVSVRVGYWLRGEHDRHYR